MKKREAKIEALNIAYGLCTSCDLGMFDGTQYESERDEEKVLRALHELGRQLYGRAERMERANDEKP